MVLINVHIGDSIICQLSLLITVIVGCWVHPLVLAVEKSMHLTKNMCSITKFPFTFPYTLAQCLYTVSYVLASEIFSFINDVCVYKFISTSLLEDRLSVHPRTGNGHKCTFSVVKHGGIVSYADLVTCMHLKVN